MIYIHEQSKQLFPHRLIELLLIPEMPTMDFSNNEITIKLVEMRSKKQDRLPNSTFSSALQLE